MSFCKSPHFWRPAVFTAAIFGAFFAWQLGYFGDLLPTLSRPAPSQLELVYTCIIILLLALDSGLSFFRMKQGTCPLGAKRATKIAGGLGVVTLLCPACLVVPISLFGVSLSFALLSPFLPLLQSIVILLLAVSAVLLWPKS